MGAWLKAHTIAVLIAAVVILLTLIGVILFNLNSTTPAASVISKVTYSQSQAGTNVAPKDVVVTDPAKLRALSELLTKYDITPGVTDTLGASTGCVGGLTSSVRLEYTNATSTSFSTYVCGTTNPDFSVALSDLLAGWSE